MKNLDKFYRENNKRLINQICRGKGLDRDTAEDVVQEAFLNAIKYYHNFNSERGPLKAWFNMILRNTFYDRYNAVVLAQEDSLDRAENLSDIFECRGGGPSPEELGVIKTYLDLIENPKHKKIAEMYYLAGYTSIEIAQVEKSLTQTNVTTIIKRVRQKLQGVGE